MNIFLTNIKVFVTARPVYLSFTPCSTEYFSYTELLSETCRPARARQKFLVVPCCSYGILKALPNQEWNAVFYHIGFSLWPSPVLLGTESCFEILRNFLLWIPHWKSERFRMQGVWRLHHPYLSCHSFKVYLLGFSSNRAFLISCFCMSMFSFALKVELRPDVAKDIRKTRHNIDITWT